MEANKDNQNPQKQKKDWHRIAFDGWVFYDELTNEEAEQLRKDGCSVVNALPSWLEGIRACNFEE